MNWEKKHTYEMSADEFTIAEAKKVALNPTSIRPDAELFMQGENWGGVDNIGTREDWEAEIPVSEEDARMTGWHDWYTNEEFAGGWADYREHLMSQLQPCDVFMDPDEE